MATATIIGTWQAGGVAYMAANVPGDGVDAVTGAPCGVEYIGSVPAASLVGLTNPQKRAALVAAVKAVRDAQLATLPSPITGITGTATL